MRAVLMFGASMIVLTACSSGTSEGQVSVSYDNGAFSGKAGSNWSDEELRSNSFGVLCGEDGKVADLAISRDSKGVATISGKCV
jgi:hypothetical protein